MENVGRTTGSRRQTILEVINYDLSSRRAAVMSGWGGTSDRYRNVQVAGHIMITVGRETMDVKARALDDAARMVADCERRNHSVGRSSDVC